MPGPPLVLRQHMNQLPILLVGFLFDLAKEALKPPLYPVTGHDGGIVTPAIYTCLPCVGLGAPQGEVWAA